MAIFKARARALDMLGRQQIAGIPTAISELFKNAHDAYADRVEVDFFRQANLLMLRDDGLGMTRDDFESRWLTLGTESKLGVGVGLAPPPVDRDKDARPIMGEKGIGRLAIAAIGPQVLILTRAKSDDGSADLVAAFIHWGLFEAPGINLDQLEIPILTYRGGDLPGPADVAALVQAVRAVADRLAHLLESELLHRICADLDRFHINVRLLLDRCPGPTLSGTGHGTHFYILPADESIIPNLDFVSEDIGAPLTKLLIGFTNTMTPNHPEPHIQTVFRDHKSDSSADDIIEARQFWTPEEFGKADHHFIGAVDKFGQFVGNVSVYGDETANHIIPWTGARGRATECGPFKISVAFVPGHGRESTLPPQDHARIVAKLNRIGGLYIYKDGIRILPYGDNNVDFLDMEKRRTKSAAYYFFSYRRIFGAVEISNDHNGALSEKAGREGFRENRAYREFKAILENLFVQLAADFFREEGTEASVYNRRRDELKRADAARRRYQQQGLVRKREFTASLEKALSKVDERAPEREVAGVLDQMRVDMSAAVAAADASQAVPALLRAEQDARRKLEALRLAYRVAKPRGIGLSRQTNRDWEAYSAELARLEGDIFQPATRQVDEILSETTANTGFALEVGRRMETAIRTQADSALRSTRQLDREVREAADAASQRAITIARRSLSALERTINDVLARFSRTDFSALPDHEVVGLREQMLSEIERRAAQERELLEGIWGQLQSLTWDLDDSGHFIGTNETIEAIDEERLELRERVDLDLELTQLGLAIQVINHEFGASIRTIRENLRGLRGWAEVNPKLTPIYEGIRNSFDHLDGYLTLFTPLNRRMYRSPVDISGDDVGSFLEDLLRDRLSRHHIVLEQTARFRHKHISSYPSTFYPVFVNLVDNAIYWLASKMGDRRITLDADDDSFLIRDTGPGVRIQDRQAIFELGFTRKPGGRGLGLYIAHDVLKKAGYALSVEDSAVGAVFRIRQVQTGPLENT